MEKTATASGPILAILAGTPAASQHYLAQMATLAGWQALEEEGAGDAAASVRVGKEGQLTISSGGQSVSFTTPLKAARVIQHLKTLEKAANAIPPLIHLGTYTLKPRDYLLIDAAGQAARLTEKETAILVYLSQQDKGVPIGRQTLLDAVWGYAQGVETHTLETHIYRLRQKIEDDPADPKTLLTVEDGYVLAV